MSKSTRKSRRNKIVDVVFIIDSTESSESFLEAFHDKVGDLAFEFQISYKVSNLQFACICYRDPVDCKSDVHQVFEFDDELENLVTFLVEDVKASGGGDGPEDFVGALNLAINDLSWRDHGKRIIFWLADGPAHGKRFCDLPNHPEEEPKLVSLIEKIAREGYFFIGMYTNKRSEKTFSEMKKIFDANRSRGRFVIEEFTPEKSSAVDDLQYDVEFTYPVKPVFSEALEDY